jgi:hypothetical protein
MVWACRDGIQLHDPDSAHSWALTLCFDALFDSLFVWGSFPVAPMHAQLLVRVSLRLPKSERGQQHLWKEERNAGCVGRGPLQPAVLHSLPGCGLRLPADGLLRMRLSHIRGMALGMAVFSVPGLSCSVSLFSHGNLAPACPFVWLVNDRWTVAHYRCHSILSCDWRLQCSVARLFARSSVNDT